MGKLDKVLEIGTGSGYQSAVLSPLVGQLYSVERIEVLHLRAKARLAELGYSNVHVALSDGSWGWPEFGPYQGILLPPRLKMCPNLCSNSLPKAGALVLPVGGKEQQLMLITRRGEHFQKITENVHFVPFLSGIVR